VTVELGRQEELRKQSGNMGDFVDNGEHKCIGGKGLGRRRMRESVTGYYENDNIGRDK
jgi:hypothetical protein